MPVKAKRQKNDVQARDRPKQVLGLDSAGPTCVLVVLKGESCLEEQGELGKSHSKWGRWSSESASLSCCCIAILRFCNV